MNYIEQDFKGSSGTKNIYQNASNKIKLPEEKNWTIPLLLKSPKSITFQSSDLEIDFLIDSRAESSIKNILIWNDIQTLHSKLIPSKTTSKSATAQGSCLTYFGKIKLFLIPTRTMEQNKLLTKPFKKNIPYHRYKTQYHWNTSYH